MRCPTLTELPSPPLGKTGWPWTEETPQLLDTMPDGRPWPRVSIVTPSYNQGQFIEESIRSVLLQGYPDLEFLIIDGASTDGSVDIIRKYGPWLAYWMSEPDRGQSHAINIGLERSTGRLFNWHNADDVLTPNSLATTAAAAVRYPSASYVHGYRIVIDSQSNVLCDTKHTLGCKTDFVPELTRSVSNLKGGCQPGCLMDQTLVVELGMVDEDLHYIMDVDLTLRLALVRPPLYIGHPVVYSRVYPDVKSCSWNAQRAKERLILARKLFSRTDLPPAVWELRREAFAAAHRFAWRCYAEAKMYRSALWHVLHDIFYSPRGGWGTRRAILYKLDSLKQEKVLAILCSGAESPGRFYHYCSRFRYSISRMLRRVRR